MVLSIPTQRRHFYSLSVPFSHTYKRLPQTNPLNFPHFGLYHIFSLIFQSYSEILFFVMTTITASLSIALQIFNRISNWTPSSLLQLKKNSHLYKCWERKMGKLFNFLMNFTTTIHKGVFQKSLKPSLLLSYSKLNLKWI